MLIISGDILRSHYDWLERHAETEKSGSLCCKRTGERMFSRVLHYVRHNSQGRSEPFQNEMEPGDGTMIHFATFWCRACQETPAVPELVYWSDIVSLTNGVVG